ncbi:class I SAM-dependent methyltransferase [Corynebacterium sp. UBA2622]|uniref:class I SAM-dependent methyltransferase n=1 Tax=Corynebacterium sp. UBA2622 TaxID=1946393 RepID=UPI0025C537D3|nr:class I SAM-dependent methyltransferase [Corynebacterium sp. UBA2622]
MRPSRKDTPAFRDAEHRLYTARSFHTGADTYDVARPSYPSEVAELLDAPSTVLELGAGTGKFTSLLARSGHTVLACDPSPEMTRVLRRNCPGVPVWRASAERTAVRSASVDAVAAAQTWHWVDAARASAEADRVVRPGGGLLLCWNTLDVSHPWVLRLSRIMHSGDVQREGFYPDVRPPWGLAAERRLRWLQPAPAQALFDLMATRSYWLRASESTRAKMTANLTWYLYDRLGFEPGQVLPLPYRTDAFLYLR